MTEQTERRLTKEELASRLGRLNLRGELLAKVLHGLNTVGYPDHVVLEAVVGLTGHENLKSKTEEIKTQQ